MKHNLYRVLFFAFIVAGCGVQSADSQAKPTPTHSAYGNLQNTEIRGITPEDIEGLRTGKGMGLALPAELNGYPGPRHVLDLVEELGLTVQQEEQIQALFDAMQVEAIALGERILAAEAALEDSFRQRSITTSSLEEQLTQISELRLALRLVHLETHLATIEILTEEQIQKYQTLRGYDEMQEDHAHGNQHEGG
ncbi:MAG: Spy/CpxP family protein refolding chaperone [Anaerolineae bacterium]|nr:Spy/CpxP family protein refolding chaperone [Anaerolineae bacterium]